MIGATLAERACGAEGAGRWIPDLRCREGVARGIPAADEEDTTVSQEGGGVILATLGERACGAERAGRRIPDLGLLDGVVLAAATDDEDTAVSQEGGGVTEATRGEGTCGAERPDRGCLVVGREQA